MYICVHIYICAYASFTAECMYVCICTMYEKNNEFIYYCTYECISTCTHITFLTHTCPQIRFVAASIYVSIHIHTHTYINAHILTLCNKDRNRHCKHVRRGRNSENIHMRAVSSMESARNCMHACIYVKCFRYCMAFFRTHVNTCEHICTHLNTSEHI